MKIKLRGEEYKLRFWHEYGGTGAKLVFPDGKFLEAKSILHKKDSPNKKIGRKMALTRLLKSARLTKEERKSIWQQYFIQTAPK